MIMVKRDGSVSIHSDDRAYKPINWMLPPCLTQIEELKGGKNKPIQRWTVTNKNETLVIDIYKIISEDNHELAEQEPGLNRSWTEKHLQAWIAGHVELLFGAGWSLIGREHQTGAGPVDIFVRNEYGIPVAVEVKRTATMNAIDQAGRYVGALASTQEYSNVIGMVIALKIQPRALLLAQERGIGTLIVPEHLYKKTD